jgi:anaerobic selenocysteine-containing dehydrogenase
MGEGDMVTLQSRVNSAKVQIHITEDIRAGVVSLPHGYGHKGLSSWQKVAAANPGISVNDWTDDVPFEKVVAQSILNGVPVELVK